MRRLLAVAVLAVGCTRAVPPSPAAIGVEALATPAGPRSSEPQLRGDVLSWVELTEDGLAQLRFARFKAGRWSDATTAATGRDWFLSGSDVPSVVGGTDGALAAHWLRRVGGKTFAFDVVVSWSPDGGRTWTEPVTPHRDGVAAEHGFVSLVAAPGGRFDVLWLDGRDAGGEGGRGATALRSAVLGPDGLSPEEVVDARVCDCCQTAAARAGGTLVAIYRDRGATEVRDISVTRRQPTGWSAPAPLGPDGWTIAGCPVNGPAMAARDGALTAAWFGAPGDRAHVKLRRSTDAGFTWGPEQRVDEGQPLGRVDVADAPGGTLVSWIEKRPEGAVILVRRVGEAGPPVVVAGTSGGRAAGVPRLEWTGEAVIAAWTQDGPVPQVRTARLTLP